MNGSIPPSVDLVDQLPDAVIVLDDARVITAVNEAATELLGRPGKELVGSLADDILAPRTRDGKLVWVEGWPRAVRLSRVRRIPEQEVDVLAAAGPVRVGVTGRYLRDGDGRLLGLVLVLRPIARRANLAASGVEIVSTVSHELRSPLTSVKGYTSLLLNRWDRLDDEQKQLMLAQVHHDADRVTRLVTELLDISRLETGRLHLRRQMIDVPAISQSVVEKVALEYADLDCTVDFAESFPRVYADPDKVEQVLTNLLENAAKYASPRHMQVTGRVLDGRVEVAVHDVGEGIPAVDLPRVFAKFFRRDHGKPTGSGLGLWISRGLVEAHGGQLTASSKVGQGSVFAFTLPTDAFERLHEN